MRMAFAPSAWCRPVNAPNSSLSAVLVHNGEKILLAQDFDPSASGCRLDLAEASECGSAGRRGAWAGADLLIVNRFGKRERDGKGLAYLVERALDADIPVVIAVSSQHFGDWIKFADGMSVKLHCDRAALEAWWDRVSASERRCTARQFRQPSAKSPNRLPSLRRVALPPLAIAVPHAHESNGLSRTSL